jgi:hypothetical protein
VPMAGRRFEIYCNKIHMHHITAKVAR